MTSGLSSWPVVAALSLAVTSCDNSPIPQPTAPTPALVAPSTTPSAVPEARFSLTVDSLGSQHAITGLSEVNVDATASTGSGLRYVVDFGDGTTASEATTRHVYGAAGTFRVTVTVTDSANQTAATSRELIVASPLGAWLHSGYVSSSHFVEVRTLLLTEQRGATVRGVVSRVGQRDLDITGTLTADRRVRINVQGLSETLEGDIPSVFGGNVTWPLVARGGPANGETLTFSRRPGEPTGPAPLAALRLRFLSFDAPFAIIGLTPINFDAADSSGDGLKYFIEFGDGEISTSQTTVHTIGDDGSSVPTVLCGAEPNFKARLTVVDRYGRSDVDTDLYLVKTLIGPMQSYYWWEGGSRSGSSMAAWVQIETQRGSQVAGRFRYFLNGPGTQNHATFTGTVKSDGHIRLTLDNGERLSGSLTLGKHERLDLTWSGGPNHGTTLELHHRCNY